MRCLTLADMLRRQGASVQFVCREHPGNLCDWIQETKFPVYRLPFSPHRHFTDTRPDERWLGETSETDAGQTAEWIRTQFHEIDLLVVDHYSIDFRWEQRLRPVAKKIMVIDDLANRAHDCDLLLDQNLYDRMEERYKGLIPDSCVTLLGPRHVLLREEFHAARPKARVRDGTVRRLFVFFGGSDPTNETEKALEALSLLNLPGISADVVVGRSNPYHERIASLSAQLPNVAFHRQIDYMADLMLKADLAIGAGGTTTWERCYLGLPAIVVTTAHNQIEVAKAASKAGILLYLGHHSEVAPESIADALVRLMEHPESLARMSRTGMELVGSFEQGEVVDVARVLLSML